MNWKKIFKLIFVSALMALFLGACQREEEAEPEPTTTFPPQSTEVAIEPSPTVEV